jgi:hypothetical protein
MIRSPHPAVINLLMNQLLIVLLAKIVEVTHLDIMKKYLNYVRDPVKNPTNDTIIKAFDFVLSQVGMDFFSNNIWLDYINFIKKSKV